MILDDDGQERTSGALRVAPGAAKAFTLRIECRAGYVLKAVSVADVVISAKAAPGDTFQDIEADPLELSPFAGEIKTFYCQAAADADAIRRDDIAKIIVALA